MRSSKLNDVDRSILQRYVPKYGITIPAVSEKSVAVFLAALYQDDLRTVMNYMSNPVYDKYYKYYLTMQKIVDMIFSTEAGILTYEYIVDIYKLLFDVDRGSLPAVNKQYDHMIVDACNKMDELITGKSKKCDIVIVSDVLYRYVNMRVSGNLPMDYIVGYIVVNYLMIYLGYTVLIPVYEANDVLNSILLTDIDPRSVKSLIGKKILYGLDYANDVVYYGM